VEAAELYRKSLAEKTLAVGQDSAELAPELSALARALWRAGAVDEARVAMDHVARLTGASDGQWHLYHGDAARATEALRAEAAAGDSALVWEDLAEAESARGDQAAAREAGERAAEIWKQSLAPDHPRVLACSGHALAGSQALGRTL
jgi:tetratricopeptide (TPR) repeat protein